MNFSRQMLKRFKTPVFLMLGMIAPVASFATSNYCVAVNGGFGSAQDGTTFIGTGFSLPSEGTCAPWVGFAKSSASVISTTTGTGCVSSDDKSLTLSFFSVDPDWFGTGTVGHDYIVLCLKSGCGAAHAGEDQGDWEEGPVKEVSCSSSLLKLPDSHD